MARVRSIGLVAVGVDHAVGLKPLSGAASGAKAVVDWMLTNQVPIGVKVDHTLITDVKGKPVTAKQVKDAAKAFVDKRAIDVLILYFASHGIIKAVDEEHVL